MMMAFPTLIIGLAFVTAILLVLFFLGVMVVREFTRPVRDTQVKPKRDEHDRLIFDGDGELVDLWEEDGDHAQRSRNP